MSIKDIIQEQKERSAKFKTEYKKAGVQEPFVFYYDCLLDLAKALDLMNSYNLFYDLYATETLIFEKDKNSVWQELDRNGFERLASLFSHEIRSWDFKDEAWQLSEDGFFEVITLPVDSISRAIELSKSFPSKVYTISRREHIRPDYTFIQGESTGLIENRSKWSEKMKELNTIR